MSLVNVPISVPLDDTPGVAQDTSSVSAPLTLSVRGAAMDSFAIDVAGTDLRWYSEGWAQLDIVTLGPSGQRVLNASNWAFAMVQMSYWRIRRLVGTGAMVVNLSSAPLENQVGPTGPEGPEGPAGPDGAAGSNAFSLVSASGPWVWPTEGIPQTVGMSDVAWLNALQYVFVSDGTSSGILRVVSSVTTPTPAVTWSNVGQYGPAAGTMMANGAKVTPGGYTPPQPGGNVAYATGNAFTTVADPGCTASSVHIVTLTKATSVDPGSFWVEEGTNSFRVYSSQQIFNGGINWIRKV